MKRYFKAWFSSWTVYPTSLKGIWLAAPEDPALWIMCWICVSWFWVMLLDMELFYSPLLVLVRMMPFDTLMFLLADLVILMGIVLHVIHTRQYRKKMNELYEEPLDLG